MILINRRHPLFVLCPIVFGVVTIWHLALKQSLGLLSRNTAKEEMVRARVDKLNKMCNELDNNRYGSQNIQTFKFNHIFVDDKYKLIFCYVPKVACTNFLRMFLALSDNTNISDPAYVKGEDVRILKKNLTYLDSLSVPEVAKRLKHYKKIIFVREPLERLLSAFRNKFFQSNNPIIMGLFGNMIIQKYRDNFTKGYLGKGVHFTEFVRYLLDTETIKQGFNEHWESFSDLCHPCFIRYNYIGKYESFEEDVDGLLKLLNIKGKVEFPRREIHYKTAKSSDVMSEFYRDIEPEMFQNLIKLYSEDYAIFDYEIPSRQQIIQKRKLIFDEQH